MYIKVTVVPDFREEEIGEVMESENGPGEIKMYIREEAVRGQANKKVLKVLQEYFPNKRIRIVSGHLSTKKLIEIN